MTDKLSDKLWDILNDSNMDGYMSVKQLCAIDEARALAKRVEVAPVESVSLDARECQFVPCDFPEGTRVRLVLEGES